MVCIGHHTEFGSILDMDIAKFEGAWIDKVYYTLDASKLTMWTHRARGSAIYSTVYLKFKLT